MSSSSGVSSTRWLAYDSRDVDVNNVELEPGNGRRREVAWSEERAASAGCRWTGVHKHAQAAAVTSTLAASAVPHRTLTISDAGTRKPIAQRDVYFLPHSFLDLPAALSVPPHTSTSTLCSDLLERTIDGFIQADSISQGDAYARFRFVWMQARGDAGSNEGSGDRKEEEEQLFTKHTNLFAPITTHDHKTFVSNVLRSVRTTNADGPDTTFSRMDTTLQAERCGMLPQIPFAGDISDPRAMLVELLATIVHTQMCVTREWNLDARTWSGEITTEKITAGWEASCQHVSEWLSALLERHLRYLSFLARCYRELMPAKTLLQILDTALPFSWKDPFVQAGLVWYVMNDAVAMQYPPSIDHRLDVWKTLSQAIEDEGVLEVHSDILLRIQELTRMKGKAEPAELAQSHWTVTYRDDVDPSASSSSSLQTCTLKMETGFSSTTGCSLWPAGMLMCEFILANRHIFEGKRVLELGVGIGLTSTYELTGFAPRTALALFEC
jgi:hypothetical protein